MMTVRQRRWLSVSLATGLVLLLVFVASFDMSANLKAPERFVLTEVTTFEAPPLPPPPPSSRSMDSRSGGSTGVDLTLRRSTAPAPLERMQLDVQFAAAEVGPLNIAGLGKGIGLGTGDGTGDGSGFGLALVSELDQIPTIVSAPVFPFPDEARQRGLTEFDLRYHILIDEEGLVYPITLVETPFPSLTAEFMDFASRVRFTPPTRLGIPVRTEYLWPVKIRMNPSRSGQ